MNKISAILESSSIIFRQHVWSHYRLALPLRLRLLYCSWWAYCFKHLFSSERVLLLQFMERFRVHVSDFIPAVLFRVACLLNCFFSFLASNDARTLMPCNIKTVPVFLFSIPFVCSLPRWVGVLQKVFLWSLCSYEPVLSNVLLRSVSLCFL